MMEKCVKCDELFCHRNWNDDDGKFMEWDFLRCRFYFDAYVGNFQSFVTTDFSLFF